MLKNRNAQGMSIKMIIVTVIGLIVFLVVVMLFSGKFGEFRGGLKSAGDPTKTCESQGGQPTDGECGQNRISILSKDAGAKGMKCCKSTTPGSTPEPTGPSTILPGGVRME